MKQHTHLLWGGLGLAMVVVLAMGLRSQPILVEIATIDSSTMRVSITEEGNSRVKDRYVISAPVSGFIRRTELKVGDSVEQQALLTELEPLRSDVLDPRRRAEAEAQIAAARSGLLSAEEQTRALQADAEYVASEYRRKQQLNESHTISEDELSAARAADRRAKALLRSAKFAEDVARYELNAASTLLKYSAAQNSSDVFKERVAIRTPVAGSVLKLHHESEGVVSAGTPLIELGDPAALEIAIDVLSFDAVRIEAGDKVELTRWGGAALDGTVRLVEPVGFTDVSALGVEEQRVWVIVDITSDPQQWQSLGDGYRVEANFVLWQENNVLQAPSASLFRTDEGWAVYAIDGDYAQRRQVKIGKRNGLSAQIIEGLAEGEQVIQHPDNAISDGARIKVRK